MEAVDAAGFQGLVVGTADLEQVDQQLLVRITGMTCSSCSTAVEKALQAVPGVRSAAVSLVQSRAEVRPPCQDLEPRPVISRVQSLAKVWGQCRVWTCSQGLNRWHCAVPQVGWQRLAGGVLAGADACGALCRCMEQALRDASCQDWLSSVHVC